MAVVEVTKEGRIAIFTINRPEAMNALSAEVHQGLNEAMLAFRDDPELWVAIITGAGDKAFSAGADLRAMSPTTGEGRRGGGGSCYRLADKIWKPFIAAINGYALGGGLELALSCDIRIAAEHARLGLPEVTRGRLPGGGGRQYLPRFIPRAIASWMLLSGQPLDAQEAYRVGLVNKVVPLDQLMPTAMQMAQTICEAAPLPVRASKESMLRGINMTLEEGFQVDNEVGVIVANSEDRAEGVRAFQEKRKPVWKGR